jgi:UDP-glucose 4-epimerase
MVVPRFVSAAMRGEPLQVYGDGEQSRCFCDARDVASALPRMLRASSCHGRVFNVGSDRSVTMNELAQLVLKLVGSPTVGIKHVPYEKVYGEAFEDLRVRRPDLTRIREAIGFAPSITLEQTILDIAREQREKMSAK